MGAFDEVANITLPDPDDAEKSAAFRKKWGWDPHEQVIIRGSYTAGDQEIITNASVGILKKGDTQFQAGTARTQLLNRMILDWTFKRNGVKVPKTLENVKRLTANYTTPILEVCDRLATGMTEEEQEDFFDSANGHSSDDSEKVRMFLTQS